MSKPEESLSYDLAKVLQQATEVTQRVAERGGSNSNRLRLLYPQNGTALLKVLFNPASGLALRRLVRHTVNDTKLPCMEMYGGDCPLCKKLAEIKSVKGTDLYNYAGKIRGLSAAIFINSNYAYDKPEDAFQQGDRIWLMYPWTVFKDLSRIVAEAGVNSNQILATNKGKIIKISRIPANNRVDYKTELDAFDEYTCCQSDQEFFELLNSWDNLSEHICPSTPNDQLIESLKEAAKKLHETYLLPSVHQPGMDLGIQPPAFPGNYGQVVPQGTTQVPMGTPQQYNYGVQFTPGMVPPQAPGMNPVTPGTGPPQQPVNAGVVSPPVTPNQVPPMNNQPPISSQPRIVNGVAVPDCYEKYDQVVDKNNCLICPHEAPCRRQHS